MPEQEAGTGLRRGRRHLAGGIAVLVALFVSVLLGFLHIAAHAQAVAPNGSDEGLWRHLFLAGPVVLMLILALPVSLICLVVPRTRLFGMYGLAAVLLMFVSIKVSADIGNHIRMQAFAELARRSQPLIDAIHAYELDHGQPPTQFADLVPHYLSDIPETGIAAYPVYEYELSPDPHSHEGNPWVLWVKTPSGGINFDRFIYLPKQNYPDVGYGGVLVEIEDWAYVHE